MSISGSWVRAFIVFLCSFIPVAGVFLSTLPMAVAALSEYGVTKVNYELVYNCTSLSISGIWVLVSIAFLCSFIPLARSVPVYSTNGSGCAVGVWCHKGELSLY